MDTNSNIQTRPSTTFRDRATREARYQERLAREKRAMGQFILFFLPAVGAGIIAVHAALAVVLLTNSDASDATSKPPVACEDAAKLQQPLCPAPIP